MIVSPTNTNRNSEEKPDTENEKYLEIPPFEIFLSQVLSETSASMAKIYISLIAFGTGVAMWILGVIGAVDAEFTEYGILGLIILVMSRDIVPWLIRKSWQAPPEIQSIAQMAVTIAELKKDIEFLQRQLTDVKAAKRKTDET